VTVPIHPVPTSVQGSTETLLVNLFRTTGSTVLVAPLPGVMPEHVQVVVDDAYLTITAERDRDADHDYLLHEWNPAVLQRSIALPDDVGWPITASMAHGQLTITLARRGHRPDGEAITIVPTAPRHESTDGDTEVIDLRRADRAAGAD
jgi:HSP20 family molecular chaperone IbpA